MEPWEDPGPPREGKRISLTSFNKFALDRSSMYGQGPSQVKKDPRQLSEKCKMIYIQVGYDLPLPPFQLTSLQSSKSL